MPDAAFYNRWDLGLGIITLVPLSLFLVFVHWINSRRPSKMVHTMDGLLKGTESLLYESVEDGLINGAAANGYRTMLDQLTCNARSARDKAFAANSFWGDIANMYKGLTKDISRICESITHTRSLISSASLRERERLRQESQMENLPTSTMCGVDVSGATPVAPETSHHGESSDAPSSTDSSPGPSRTSTLCESEAGLIKTIASTDTPASLAPATSCDCSATVSQTPTAYPWRIGLALQERWRAIFPRSDTLPQTSTQ